MNEAKVYSELAGVLRRIGPTNDLSLNDALKREADHLDQLAACAKPPEMSHVRTYPKKPDPTLE